jgi:hypothetical protein
MYLMMGGLFMKIMELQMPDYVPVNYKGAKSFGGNQGWFPTERILHRGNSIHRWGCGTIAVADLFLYLARSDKRWNTTATSLVHVNHPVIALEDYVWYIEFMHNRFAPVMPGSGMTGLAVARAVRHYAIKYQIPLRIAWKAFMDDEEMLKAIRRMIRANLPVILSIGPNMPLVFMNKGVTFYTKSTKEDNTKLEHYIASAKDVHKHFVVVTGIVALKNKQQMLKISSWGREYYIHYQELRDYINLTGDTLTSSMLYMSWRE